MATQALAHCTFCPKVFSEDKYLQQHIVKNHPAVHLKCIFCPSVFQQMSSLRIHLVRAHGISAVDLANTSKKLYVQVPATGQAEDEKPGYSPQKQSFSCQSCRRNFATDRALKIHMNKTHSVFEPQTAKTAPAQSTESGFGCDLCGRCFPTEKQTKIHRYKMHIEGANRDRDMLGKAGGRPSNESSGGSGSKPPRQYQPTPIRISAAATAKKLAPKPSTAGPAAVVAEKDEDVDLVCRHCGFQCANKWDKDVHEWECCNQEDDAAPLCIDMEETKREVVTKEKNIQEQLLNYMAAARADAGTPASTDSQQGDFHCTTCGRNFPTEKALKIHRFKIHPKDWKKDHQKEVAKFLYRGDFGCQQCGRTFATGKSLKIHVFKAHIQFANSPSGAAMLSQLSEAEKAGVAPSEMNSLMSAAQINEAFSSIQLPMLDAELSSTNDEDGLSVASSSGRGTGKDSPSPTHNNNNNSNNNNLPINIFPTATKHTTSSSSSTIFPCKKCGKQFFHRSNMYRHMKLYCKGLEHENNRAQSLREQQLKAAATPKKPSNEKPLDLSQMTSPTASAALSDSSTNFCQLCSKFFHDARAKKIHMTRMHPGAFVEETSPPQGLLFPNLEMLQQPIEMLQKLEAAAGEKLVSPVKIPLRTPDPSLYCPVCHKFFSHRSVLQRHIKVHRFGKAYSCNLCHKAFTRKYNLMLHKKINCRTGPLVVKAPTLNRQQSVSRSKLQLQNGIARSVSQIESENGKWSVRSNAKFRTFEEVKEAALKIQEAAEEEEKEVTSVAKEVEVEVAKPGHSICDKCNKSFKTSMVQMHQQYFCKGPVMPAVEAPLETEEVEEKVEEEEEDTTLFKCSDCDMICGSQPALIVHRLHFHSQPMLLPMDPEDAPLAVPIPPMPHSFSITPPPPPSLPVSSSSLQVLSPLSDDEAAVDTSIPRDMTRFICKFCSKEFPHRLSLTGHMKTHLTEGNKKHQCDSCMRRFTTKNNLRFHKAKFCKGPQYGGALLLEQQRNIQKRSSPKQHPILSARPDLSPRRIAQIKEQVIAEVSQTGSGAGTGTLSCSNCSARFSDFMSLHNHIIHEHTKTDVTPTSSTPDKEDSAAAALRVAMSGGNIQCPHCSKRFHSTNAVKIHGFKVHNVHLEDGDLRPDDGEGDNSLTELQPPEAPLLNASGDSSLSNSTFVCHICNKVLPSPTSLALHSRTHDNSDDKTKPHQCMECKKRFSTKSTLLSHQTWRCPAISKEADSGPPRKRPRRRSERLRMEEDTVVIDDDEDEVQPEAGELIMAD